MEMSLLSGCFHSKPHSVRLLFLDAIDFIVSVSCTFYLSRKHNISTGFLGSSPRNTLVDRGSLYIHERPTIPSDTLAADRRLDTANTISSDQRQRILRVPSGHDASDWARNGFDRRGWVDCILLRASTRIFRVAHHQPVACKLF